MRSLYLRIYLTVVVALALFALVTGWLMQRHFEQERTRNEGMLRERALAWVELLQRSLPDAAAPEPAQAQAVHEWSAKLRLPMALEAADGRRIVTSESFQRRQEDDRNMRARVQAMPLDDGRTLLVYRPGLARGAGPVRGVPPPPPPWWAPPRWMDGANMALLMVVLFVAVAAGAWPVVRRLTHRLESLRRGVEAFGTGKLDHRVQIEGRDEVAAVAASFNRAAGQIETLMRSHQSLLANASHELRSPLARLKMAVAMLDGADNAQFPALRREIDTNIGELDQLVDEVLLASRLDARADALSRERVDLLALAAEEAARVQAPAQGSAQSVPGDERLLRRALRNLLENARRYGGGEIAVEVADAGARAELRVMDRGPGVPEAFRDRIFEAFFRMPGHAEREGGVGLGLALVRQIAERHGGAVRCQPRDGGGSCFVVSLPKSAPA
jgi:signal transduction histidine kinase